MAKTHGSHEKQEIISHKEHLVRQASMEHNIEDRFNIHTTIPEPNRASS